jgi:hypothetical protein
VNTLENLKSQNNLHHRLWEKNLTVGSSKLVDSDFMISTNGSSRCVDARTSDARNPKTQKKLCVIDLRLLYFTRNRSGHMNVYHVPVGRGEKREWWNR